MAKPIGFYLSTNNAYLSELETRFGSDFSGLTERQILILLNRLTSYLLNRTSKNQTQEEEALEVARTLALKTTDEEQKNIIAALSAMMNDQPQQEALYKGDAEMDELLKLLSSEA